MLFAQMLLALRLRERKDSCLPFLFIYLLLQSVAYSTHTHLYPPLSPLTPLSSTLQLPPFFLCFPILRIGICLWVWVWVCACACDGMYIVVVPLVVSRYEAFLQDTACLGSLDTYPQLTSRATRIGYRISKVVYRGYQAPQSLQVHVLF